MLESVKPSVAVRCRPLLETEFGKTRCNIVRGEMGEDTITVRAGQKERTFEGIGSHALSDDNQQLFYQQYGEAMLDEAISLGVSSSLIIYGPSGSGRNYTAFGDGEDDGAGVFIRFGRDLFNRIENGHAPRTEVKLEVAEVINEVANDLIADRSSWTDAGLRCKIAKTGGHVLDGSTSRPCTSFAEFQRVLKAIKDNKTTTQGPHGIWYRGTILVTVHIETFSDQPEEGAEGEEMVGPDTSADVTFVVLPPAETVNSEGVKETQGAPWVREVVSSERLLLGLGNALKNISEGKRANFRDSKVLLLLQRYLTLGRVNVIFCLSPTIEFEEVVAALRFAERSSTPALAGAEGPYKVTKNANSPGKIAVRKGPSVEELNQRIQELEAENRALKDQVTQLSDRQVVSPRRNPDGQRDDAPLDQQVAELQETLMIYQQRCIHLQDLLDQGHAGATTAQTGDDAPTATEEEAPATTQTTSATRTTNELVTETWAQVKEAFTLEAVGQLFYDGLFNTAPSLKDTLFKNVDMEKQGLVLLKTIDAAVGLLDSPDDLVPILIELGERHAGYGAEEAHYAVVGDVFLQTLATGLGDKFTQEVREAWAQVYGVISGKMLEGQASEKGRENAAAFAEKQKASGETEATAEDNDDVEH